MKLMYPGLTSNTGDAEATTFHNPGFTNTPLYSQTPSLNTSRHLFSASNRKDVEAAKRSKLEEQIKNMHKQAQQSQNQLALV
mmetsp:Transcript_13014/g.15700  ORF Transcript_13014/g.15700 Transcript_13014/m.15700 type:complete len:82 (+) Transcript_13014:1-246(+)